MNKKRILLVVFALIVVFLFSYFFNPVGRYIDSRAVQDTVELGVTIVESKENNINVPASGAVIPNPSIQRVITNITDLTSGWKVNISLEGASYPDGWSETPPNSSEIGTNKFWYVEISVDSDTTGGTYPVHFNLTQNELGNLPANNVSLIIYDDTTGWTNLSTTVKDGTSDPASFSGITSHFSKFIIAEQPPPVEEEDDDEEPTSSPETPSGGSGGGGAAPPPIKEEKPIIKTPKLKPIHKKGEFFDVSLKIPEKYRKVKAGEDIISEVNVTNIKKVGLVGVNVEYYIENETGGVIFKRYETRNIENQIVYLETIDLPGDINPGEYMLVVKVIYNNDTALAGYPFEVIRTLHPQTFLGKAIAFTGGPFIVFAIPLMLALIVIILVVLYLIHKKTKKHPKKIIIHKNKIIKSKVIIDRSTSPIKRKLSLLKESYKKGYIKKEIYQKTKEKLGNLLKK